MKNHFTYSLGCFGKKILALSFIAIGLSSCSSENAQDKGEFDQDTTVIDSASKKAQKVLFSLPSPLETASLLKKSGATYSKDLLNPIENVSKYSTNTSKAINLGVYGADLSYTTIFDQTQESMFYLSCAKKLADGLGITSAFNQETIDRMEQNMSNQDSMLSIVSDSYMSTDAYLKENDRASTSALIIAGGWIEGLYIGSSIASKNPGNKDMRTLIADQKYSLKNLVELLDSYQNDQSVSGILPALKEINSIFESVKEVAVKDDTKDAGGSSGVTIGGDTELSLTDDQLKQISEKINKLRTSIING